MLVGPVTSPQDYGMDQLIAVLGWFFLASMAFGVLLSLAIPTSRLITKSRPPHLVGAELPFIEASIDLGKRYDIVYGVGHGASHERLSGVRILGYLRSDRDQTTGEHMDSRRLVVELPDNRRAYLRPRSVMWLLEAKPDDTATSEENGGSHDTSGSSH